MYLLLDECCGKSLVEVADEAGHTAQRTVDVAMLGRGAPDHDIFEFARQNGAVLVTVNAKDFIALAAQGKRHPGVVLIPSLPAKALRPLFIACSRRRKSCWRNGKTFSSKLTPAGRSQASRPDRLREWPTDRGMGPRKPRPRSERL